MNRRTYREKRGFMHYIQETWRNKLGAIFAVAVGTLPVFLDNGDATALVVSLIFAIPMFFSRKSWFE